MNTEYSPEPQEFEWHLVQEDILEWRLGHRVRILRNTWPKILRWVAVVSGCAIVSNAVYGLLQAQKINPASVGFVLFATLATIGVYLWMGPRRVLIDWAAKKVEVSRGHFVQRFQLSDIERVELRSVESLISTAAVRLRVRGKTIQLLESYSELTVEERYGKLYTAARRISEKLNVPLRLPLGNPDDWNPLTDEDLAEKCIDQALGMQCHASLADSRGKSAEAEKYKQYAIGFYEDAHELDPTRNEPIIALGRLLGDHQLQRKAIEFAAEEENCVVALIERAHLRSIDGQNNLAQEDYDRAVLLEPDRRTYEARASFMQDCEQFHSAIEDLGKAIACEEGETYIDEASLYSHRSDCWRELFDRTGNESDLDNAIADIRKAIEHEPDCTLHPQSLAELISLSGQYSEAISELDKLCKRNPETTSIYLSRGRLHLDKERNLPAAIKDFSKYIAMLENEPVPTGRMRSGYLRTLAYAYQLRADGYRKQADFSKADRDEIYASELQEQVALVDN